jgi:NAD(P) transhydrogenase subunit alpha
VSYPALLVDVTIFVLSLWVGFEVISKVPATLHTPLMSAANSIHGIVLAGAMLIAVTAHNAVGYVIAFLAAAFAAANVVGGYVVTGRMLKMFRRRPVLPATEGAPAQPSVTGPSASRPIVTDPGADRPSVAGGSAGRPGVASPSASSPSANGKGPAA